MRYREEGPAPPPVRLQAPMWAQLYANAAIGSVVATWDGGGDSGNISATEALDAIPAAVEPPPKPMSPIFGVYDFDERIKTLGDWVAQVVYDAMTDQMDFFGWADSGGRHLGGTVTLTERGLQCAGAETHHEYTSDQRYAVAHRFQLPPAIATCLRRLMVAFGRRHTIGDEHPLRWPLRERGTPPTGRVVVGNFDAPPDEDSSVLMLDFEFEDGPAPDVTAFVNELWEKLHACSDALPLGDDQAVTLLSQQSGAAPDWEAPSGEVVDMHDAEIDIERVRELVIHRGVDDLAATYTLLLIGQYGITRPMTSMILRDGSYEGDLEEEEEDE